ncbi:MAG: MFS transporter [Alphaproteobacteria bacterium]|nr:MFS transporter [Alphaproteobacteria bacterium]
MKSQQLSASPHATRNQYPPVASRWALVALALSILLASLGISIANVALPTFAKDFDAAFHTVQWVVLAYLLAITIMIVSAGRLGDVLGHKRVLVAGLMVFTLASLICGLAPNLYFLIAARALQGLAAAVLFALSLALVRDAVPPEKTGTAMGLMGTMSAVGTALGPSLGGLLLAGPGWPAIFLVIVPLGLATIVLALRTIPSTEAVKMETKTGFDGWGTVLLAATLAAYALAVTVDNDTFQWVNSALFLCAAVGMGLFVYVEKIAPSPLIRLSALRERTLSVGLITNCCVAAVMMTTLVVSPFYLSQALGLNTALVGIVLTVGPVISVICGIPSGWLVDRFGAPTISIVGLFEMVLGCLTLALVPSEFGVAGYIIAIAVLSPGYQLFQAANNTAIMMTVATDQRGVISGMLNLSRNLGLITGAAVMGALFTYGVGSADIIKAPPSAIATGMHLTFKVAAILMGMALILAAITRIRQTIPAALKPRETR